MASLTIRNVTINPLELKLIERFEGPSKSGGLAKIGRTVTGLFSSSNSTTPAPKEDQEPHDRQDVSDIVATPFEAKPTEIRTADPNQGEVLRLTFQSPGTEHKYSVDIPGPSTRSQVMKSTPDAPLDLTAVYTPSVAQLAIFSSAALPNWMKELRDEYPLSMLSIPGTHNSPTYHVALPSVRCQAVGVRAQLDNGVRFLDIRVSVSRDNDDLILVHSVFPVALTGARYFEDMLRDIYAFLDTNPSETVLMSVKREGTGRGTDQQLSRYLHGRYCAGDDARRWFTEPRIATLGETRGRIVLIRRFNLDEGLSGEHEGRGWGIDAAAWPDNCADAPTGSGMIRVQDFYEIDQSTNIEKKIEFARAQLERACQQQFADFAVGAPKPEGQPLPFFVNFLSASNFFNTSCWPEKIAAKVNPSIVEYLCVRHAEKDKGPAQLDVGDAGTGIVVTDWVGQNGDWDLIRCIVGWNARLQLRK
ncbi:hypothetical protein N0V82_003648 [Gnomoniopsis sp. IMI 355080]|nr:hypothetical protein N0V82_003648 [Gnomoniopsis sp. IMI 355080]